MRFWVVGVALLALSGFASADVTFTEYEAATQVAHTRANACRAELLGHGRSGPQCERFNEYMDRYSAISERFGVRMQDEGASAFDGANSTRLAAHGRTMERLTTSIHYITEMTR